MKIKHGAAPWEFELIPEDADEEEILARTYAMGHVHFVCKSLRKTPRQKYRRLLLAPSLMRWKRGGWGDA